ncbi:sodium:proline symporter [Nitrosomonas sp. JL21]|uniref:sodium:proline symporter n=1 Tax=Nitrosomonas sp. JL21 TaxID=153949 RepID=UPI0031F3F3D5
MNEKLSPHDSKKNIQLITPCVNPPKFTKYWKAIFYAGIAAGIFSTAAQIILWWLFWDALPSILYRDIRFTAAMIFGQAVLQIPATFDWELALIAACIHFSLSIVYAVGLSYLIHCFDRKNSVIIGGLFGLGIFLINMYGFVMIFPWFIETRDWITVTAHLVFGVSAARVYKAFITP